MSGGFTLGLFAPAIAQHAETAAKLEPAPSAKMCPRTNKIRYATAREAWARLWLLRRDPDCVHGDRLNVYKCKHCGDHHVGRRVA